MTNTSSKIKVSLVGDFAGTVPQRTLVVESDTDYILAAKVIRDHIEQKEIESIWVRKKAHYNWLRTYVEFVGIAVTFEEMTPRLILADSWKVTVPDWLTDEQVIGQNLLDLQITNQHIGDFTNCILASLLGVHFIKEKLLVTDLPELLSIGSPDQQILLETYPVLLHCLSEKCAAWMKNSKQSWMKKFCINLQNEPELLWHDISLWVLLHGYPDQYLEYELPIHRRGLVQQLAPEKLSDIELNSVAVNEASHQVGVFFNDVGEQIKSSEDLGKVIGCCSGRSHVEFVRVMSILQNKSSLVKDTHLSSIKQKFVSCQGVSTADLLKLDTLIAPELPANVSEGQVWDIATWCNWTTKEYIPYRNWLVENEYENEELEVTVAAFSDWYIDNYVTIHQEVDTSLVHVLTSWSDRIRNDELSLIVVVDCLPLTYFYLLLKALHVSGFHKHEQGVRFAPLPSNTDISKALLLSGDWNEEKLSYEKIVSRRVETSWPKKKAVYLPNLQTMASLTIPEEDSAVCVLNYTPSDELMHSNPAIKGMTYEDELFNCFTKLAETTHSFVERSNKESSSVSVYVVTDHGATRILESEQKNFESNIVKDLFENSKHRYAAISKEDADNIPDNLWDIGYRFEQPFVKNDTTYFIPQGHKTAGVKRSAQGYVHGGATPEEIIVPVAVFKAVESEWMAPLGRFLNTKLDLESQAAIFHIQRLVDITIAVQNPNPDPLKMIRVEMVKPESSEVREFNPCDVNGNSETTIDVKCYFKQAAKKDYELLLRFIYQYGEEERELLLSLKSIFKSATTSGFSLKNL